MLTPAEEHRHRNAIDDARHAYRGYKIRRNLLVISIIVFALWSLTAITGGAVSASTDYFAHRDMGGLFAGLIVFEIIGTFLSSVLLVCMFEHYQYRSLPRELRTAQQCYAEALAHAEKIALKRNLKAELKDQEELRDSSPSYASIAGMEIIRLRKAIRDLEEA